MAKKETEEKAERDPFDTRPSGADIVKDAKKVWGSRAISNPNNSDYSSYVTLLPTGIFNLDLALMGGIPEGGMSLVYGMPAAGKSLLSYRTIAAAQKKYPKRKIAIFDFEGSYQKNWAETHGIDHTLDTIEILNPPNGEQMADFAVQALRSPDYSLVVIDSLAFIPMKAEKEKSAEDKMMAEKARMLSRFFSNAQASMNESKSYGDPTSLLCINQQRDSMAMYGSPIALPGGKAQNYIAWAKIRMASKPFYEKDERGIEMHSYNEHSFVIDKNKIGTSFKEGMFKLTVNNDHARGAGFLDDGKDVLSFAKSYGLLTGGGASWKMDGISGSMKMADLIEYLYDNPVEMDRIKQLIVGIHRNHSKMPGLPPDNYLYGKVE